MPVQPPDKTEMARVAEHYGLGLDEVALAEFAPAEVGASVRGAADALRQAGLVVEDVSVPWHLHDAKI